MARIDIASDGRQNTTAVTVVDGDLCVCVCVCVEGDGEEVERRDRSEIEGSEEREGMTSVEK